MKTVLYLGLDAPAVKPDEQLVHFPVIKIIPRKPTDEEVRRFYSALPSFTYLLFTSKSAVRIFFEYLSAIGEGVDSLKHIKVAAVGRATAEEIRKWGVSVDIVAKEETAEGLCQSLSERISSSDSVGWPHSALSRAVITDFLESIGCTYHACVFYDTTSHHPENVPSLDDIDEIIFTSPSTVTGFLEVYKKIPWGKTLTPLGPVTEKQLFLLRD